MINPTPPTHPTAHHFVPQQIKVSLQTTVLHKKMYPGIFHGSHSAQYAQNTCCKHSPSLWLTNRQCWFTLLPVWCTLIWIMRHKTTSTISIIFRFRIKKYEMCVTHMPWCMPGSLTSDFFWSRWWGKRSWRMRNPQFYVSGKRPMLLTRSGHGIMELDWNFMKR